MATRREALKAGGGVSMALLLAAAGWLRPEAAAAATWNKADFETHSLDDAMKAMGGGAPTQSKDIAFVATPDIAENGAVVPIGVTSAGIALQQRLGRRPCRRYRRRQPGCCCRSP